MNLQLINWMGKAYPARIVKMPNVEGLIEELLVGTTDFKNALEDMDAPALDAIMWKHRILCYVDQSDIFLSDECLREIIQDCLK